MKVREMTGLICDPRPDHLEYDEEECRLYVGRFIGIMNEDIEESAKAERIAHVHLEVATRHDLYIAIYDALGSRYRSALRAYLKLWKSH